MFRTKSYALHQNYFDVSKFGAFFVLINDFDLIRHIAILPFWLAIFLPRIESGRKALFWFQFVDF